MNGSREHRKIKRITGETCKTARNLWEEVFEEDSKQFTDYYFANKAEKNIGYVIGKILDGKSEKIIEQEKVDEKKAYEIPSMFAGNAEDIIDDEFGDQ